MNSSLLKTLQSKLTVEEYLELKSSFQSITGLFNDDVNEYMPPHQVPAKSVQKWICLYESTPLTHIFTNKKAATDYAEAFEQSGQGKRLAIVKVNISYKPGEGIDD